MRVRRPRLLARPALLARLLPGDDRSRVLPMIAGIMVAADLVPAVLRSRTGPQPPVAAGLLTSAGRCSGCCSLRPPRLARGTGIRPGINRNAASRTGWAAARSGMLALPSAVTAGRDHGLP